MSRNECVRRALREGPLTTAELVRRFDRSVRRTLRSLAFQGSIIGDSERRGLNADRVWWLADWAMTEAGYEAALKARARPLVGPTLQQRSDRAVAQAYEIGGHINMVLRAWR